MTEDRRRWNRKYSEGRRSNLHHTLTEFLSLIPAGRALDIACGTGENSIFLAKKGFDVDAFDISDVAIKLARKKSRKEGVRINFKVCDAKQFPFRPERYTLIVNFYFLDRMLFAKIRRALKREGILIFETYNEDHLKINPSFNRNYLLKKGELLKAFADLRLIYYRETSNITTLVGKKA